ncbi:MAG: RsmB/NOP family class I SAM-dependent RNA methyltransferase [Desulfurococcaceae archaeon]
MPGISPRKASFVLLRTLKSVLRGGSFEGSFRRVVRSQGLRGEGARRLFRLAYFLITYYEGLRRLASAGGLRGVEGVVKFAALHGFSERSMLDELEELAKEVGGLRGLSLRHGFPHDVTERLSRFLRPNEIDAIYGSLNERKRWLRVVRARATPLEAAKCLESEGIGATRSPFAEEALKLSDPWIPVGRLSCVRRGLVVPQDVSSYLAASLAKPPGDLLVDMCSAPGIKLAQVLEGADALALALDANHKRLSALQGVLARTGIPPWRVIAIAADSTEIVLNGPIELALLDAPCTGTGAVYGDPTSKLRYSPELLRRFSELQRRLLARALANARRVLFMTCSILPEEGEEIVDWALAAGLAEPEELPRRQWASRPYRGYASESFAIRLAPNIVDGQGFFVAMLKSKRA